MKLNTPGGNNEVNIPAGKESYKLKTKKHVDIFSMLSRSCIFRRLVAAPPSPPTHTHTRPTTIEKYELGFRVLNEVAVKVA